MLNEVKSRKAGRKVISFMHISLDGFVAAPNGEMNWSKVDEEIFDHVGRTKPRFVCGEPGYWSQCLTINAITPVIVVFIPQ